MTSSEVISKELLDIGNGIIPVDPSTGFISFPPIFCQFASKEELISKVFPNINANYKNHAWLNKRAILAAKNKEVDTKIQSQING